MKTKKTFEQLADEVMPITENQQGKLIGGFSAVSLATTADLPALNAYCPNKGCNLVAGCGGKASS
jgi:hypothetical protein